MYVCIMYTGDRAHDHPDGRDAALSEGDGSWSQRVPLEDPENREIREKTRLLGLNVS